MADRIIKVDYLDFADTYWIHEERPWGVYKGVEYFKAPITIGYADTLEEAVEIARRVEKGENNGI